MKSTVIISNSLTNDFIGPDEEFLDVELNVGLREIHRLMGEGELYSKGPLPVFLNDAVAGIKTGIKNESDILSILLRDIHDPDDSMQQPELIRFGDHNLAGTKGADFVAPVQNVVEYSEVINTCTLSMPVYDFHEIMNRFLKKDILTLTLEERNNINFVITGVYSNIIVYKIASKMRNEYQFPNVFVCPHLVGSKFYDAHLSALQADLPNSLVTIVPGLDQLYEMIGLKPRDPVHKKYKSCVINPPDIADKLKTNQSLIVESMFLFHSEVALKPLSGGFSGGLLFIAKGSKNNAVTEPEIIKIDRHAPMQKEIQGYSLVKDLMGKNVPGFGLPVSGGIYTGIKMELAAMEGNPETLQSFFEESFNMPDDKIETGRFSGLFRNVLNILAEKIYINTRHEKKIYPYKEFGLHTIQQKDWLKENLLFIIPDYNIESEVIKIADNVLIVNFINLFDEITKMVDRLLCCISICHGDLNLANVICDTKENIWVIDWAHADYHPPEYDFAKLENDIKFVIYKRFTEKDLSNLMKFETLLVGPELTSLADLPDIRTLNSRYDFVKTDFRFRNIYIAVQQLRKQLPAVRCDNPDAVYRIALLKFAVHTLSFDERRGRGECNQVQLKYALLSSSILSQTLINDDIHRNVCKEKPDSYPVRFPVPVEKSKWDADYPDYGPPYYVSGNVLANDCSRTENGWADSETRCSKPQNPSGRTGIEGRGDLGLWGPNMSVDPVITRINPFNGKPEIILIKREDTGQWALPGTILLRGESVEDAAVRALLQKTFCRIDFKDSCRVAQVYVEDYRNTDNAWIETTILHLHLGEGGSFMTGSLKEGTGTMDAAWVPVIPAVINSLYANHCMVIKMVLNKIKESDGFSLYKNIVEKLLLSV